MRFGLRVKENLYSDFKLGSKVGLLMISVLQYSLVYCCLTLKAGWCGYSEELSILHFISYSALFTSVVIFN